MAKVDELLLLKELEKRDRKFFAETIKVHKRELKLLHSASRRLHRAFMMSYKPVMKARWTKSQKHAVNVIVLAMFQELVLGDLEVLRKRGADGYNHRRKMIELAAFAHECLSDAESAKRWVELGEGTGNKKKKYKSRFNAHEIVKKYFSNLEKKTLIEKYDTCCFIVHPSLFSVARRIARVAEEQYSISFHETRSTAEDEWSDLVSNHAGFALLLETFALHWNEEELFDRKLWNTTVLEVEEIYSNVKK